MRTTYKIIETEKELLELISYCKQMRYCSFDFETNAMPIHHGEFYPTILGVSFQPGSGWVIPLGHVDSGLRDFWPKMLRIFAIEVIENPAITKVAWNATFDGRIFRRYGYRVRGRYFDAMLAKYILNEERPNGLKDMTEMYLPDFAGYELSGTPGKKASQENKTRFWGNVDIDELSEYCAMDTDNCLRLFLHFETRLMDLDLYYWLRNFYMPLVRIITETQLQGVHVDREYLKGMVKDYAQKILDKEAELFDIPEIAEFNEAIIQDRVDAYIEDLEEEIDIGDLSDRAINTREEKISRMEAGEAVTKKEQKLLEPLNFKSTPQMVKLLYDHPEGYQFPILARTETKNPSASEETLLKLKEHDESGFIKNLLDLRALEKLYSTYVKNVYNDFLTEADKIHPSYLLHGTVTGRLSSRQPNFQNIPRTTTAGPIKRMYVAPPDHYFLEADLSQAELRVAAEMAKDKAMIQIFKEGKNIHVATAAGMFEVDYDLLNSARKDDDHPEHIDMVKKHKSAKVLNFTIFYGAGAKKVRDFLVERTGDNYSVQDAEDFTDKWFEAFPEADKWIQKVKKDAIRNGYSTNLFGRKRRLPLLLDKNNQKYERGSWNEALRQSVNAPIQGASSDITQWISIQVYIAVLRGDLPSYLQLVSTVHDSNEYYPHKNDFKYVAEKILQISRDLPDIKKYLRAELRRVPMKASVEYGLSWGEMHAYNPSEEKDYVEEYKILSSKK